MTYCPGGCRQRWSNTRAKARRMGLGGGDGLLLKGSGGQCVAGTVEEGRVPGAGRLPGAAGWPDQGCGCAGVARGRA